MSTRRITTIILIFLAVLGAMGVLLFLKEKERPASSPGQTLPTIAELTLAAGTFNVSTTYEGVKRTYRVHFPTSFGEDRRLPLVVVLHGGQSNAEDMERLTGFSSVADAHGFTVVYPEAVGVYRGKVYWNDGRVPSVNDVGFISALIDELVTYAHIDGRRVYVTGFSNGASMTNKLGVELEEKIAAIAPVAGTIGVRTASTWKSPRPIPVLYIHGTNDPFAFYYEGGSKGTFKGSALPAEDYVKWWAEKNGCTLAPFTEFLPDKKNDGTKVLRLTYSGCRQDVSVVFYKIEGGGHTWPGGWQWADEVIAGPTSYEFSASEAMWEFFRSHSRI